MFEKVNFGEFEDVKTAIIYARQSYGKEENALSVDQQIERCKTWCTAHKVSIQGIYKDNNTSSELYPDNDSGRKFCAMDRGWQEWRKGKIFEGRKEYRKGLAEAFNHVETARIDYFVVDETTRFYRNPSALSQLDTFCMLTLKNRKTSLVNVTENKLDDYGNEINIMLMRMLQQFDAQKVNEKAKVSRENRLKNIKNGIVFANGFGLDWINKKIHFNEEKGEAVKYVFSAVIEGKTYGEILYTLNTKYKALSTGKCFYETSIYNILSNSVYAGWKEIEGDFIEIKNLDNPPLITFSMWQKANEIVKDKKARSEKRKLNVKGESKHYLPFSGILKCGHCGRRLLMVTDKGISYFCKSTILEHDKNCTSSRIRINFDGSEDDFLRVIQPLFRLHILRYTWEHRQMTAGNKEKAQIEAEIENLLQKIRTVNDTFLNSNSLTDTEYKALIKGIEVKIKAKRNELYSLMQNIDGEADEAIEHFRTLTGTIEESISLVAESDYTNLLRETVKEITVYSDSIQISLTDGKSFSLPRLMGKRKAKKLPYGSAQTFIREDGTEYVVVEYGEGKEEKTLLETEHYRITLKS